MDIHNKETRSYNMSCIKGKDTKPEEIVRKYLFSQRFRYRKNDKRLPGTPDIVLPKYKTVIFYHDEEQKELAYKSKRELEESKIFNLPIVTEILPATVFYEAEDYHQDYYKKNPNHYYRYYVGSGRYFFTKESWDRNNVDRELLKEKLTPIQFEVTQNDTQKSHIYSLNDFIYDGNFNKNLIKGDGITCQILKKNDIIIFTEKEIEEFYSYLKAKISES